MQARLRQLSALVLAEEYRQLDGELLAYLEPFPVEELRRCFADPAHFERVLQAERPELLERLAHLDRLRYRPPLAGERPGRAERRRYYYP